jgi:hypothetical protein
MAKQKPTKAQTAYGKSRAGGQNPMRITAKEVKRTAKGVAKTAAIVATVVGPGKAVKAVSAAKKAVDTGKAARRAEATVAAAKRAMATPAAKRTEAQKLAIKKVIPTKSGGLKPRPEAKVDVNRLVKNAKKSSKDSARKERPYEEIRTTQYNPRTGKKEDIVSGSSKASQERMREFKRQGFGQSGNVVRKFKKK